MKHCLLIDDYGDFLGLEGGRIVLKGTNKNLKFPIEELESVIVTKAKGSISLAALETLLRHGIGFSILGDNQEPLASLSPRPARAYMMNRKQHEWRQNGVGAALAQQTLKSKFKAQRLLVSAMNRHVRHKELQRNDQVGITRALNSLKSLEEHLTKIKLDQQDYETSLFTVEARAAKAYWGAVKRWLPKGYHFEGRAPRPKEPCPLNAALNYGYAILSARITHLLSTEGFDPHIGYLHADSHSRASLSCDVIELYRQRYVDLPVLRYALRSKPWTLNSENRLDRATKTALAQLILDALNPRDEDGLLLIRNDLKALKDTLCSEKSWKPFPLPRRLPCPA